MEGEQPTAIIMSSSIPMFSRLETPGAQLSAVQKCPGCALPGWQDHSGPQAAPSYQPRGLGSFLHTGRVPVSSVCLFVYVCLPWLCLRVCAGLCYGASLPLLWGIFLPCGTGLVTALNGKTWKQQEGRRIEGEPSRAEQSGGERRGRETPTKMRRTVWVDCASACAPAYPGYSSISLRFFTFPSAIKPRGEK